MGVRYVAFTVGTGRYGVPVELVVQIVRNVNVTDVPTAPPYVEGVIILRGEIIPVINLRQRFGIEQSETQSRSRIIIIGNNDRLYGLLVDGVREILDLEKEEISTDAVSVFGMKPEFVQGIAKIGKDLLVVLDVFKILEVSPNMSVSLTSPTTQKADR
ncbi:MAG TPA: purine-binding chemotaxis protein CheW [bacterium]|nr:purine-binding chemotaxis protein CheW [bacterium]